MDLAVAAFLTSAEGEQALRRANDVADPSSLAAATALRRELPPDRAAAVLAQVALRRRAVGKFGADAGRLLFTPHGLEQATRGEVARYRAERMRAQGARRVVDLGCGLGADSRAFLAAGLQVVAVESDPGTAELARHNLPGVEVVCGDAVEQAGRLLDDDTVAFCDPARRTGAGRTWDPARFTPPWSFVTGLWRRRSCVKLGPGVPTRLLPGDAAAEWLSDRGDVVEATVWSGWDGRGTAAVLLPGPRRLTGDRPVPPALDRAPRPGDVLYEPDGAVLRAALGRCAEELQARPVADGIGYLIAPRSVPTGWARGFVVEEVLPWSEKTLRAWVREHRVGTLEIKKRGVDVDPARLRARLRLRGPASAGVVITPTSGGTRLLVVRRLDGPDEAPVQPQV